MCNTDLGIKEKVIEKLTLTDHKRYAEKFPENSIVYFLKKNYPSSDYSINFGVVDKVLWDEIYIDFLTIKRKYKINGIPIEEYSFPTEWKSLPKGWSYDTKLFSVEEYAEEDVPITDIKEAYNNGRLVKISENIVYGTNLIIETEIEKGKYRLKTKVVEGNEYSVGYVRKKGSELFLSYEEAKEEAIRLNNKPPLQEDDFDDIRSTLERWADIYSIPDNIKNKVFDFFFSKNPNEIEVRLLGGYIEWRYIDKNHGQPHTILI